MALTSKIKKNSLVFSQEFFKFDFFREHKLLTNYKLSQEVLDQLEKVKEEIRIMQKTAAFSNLADENLRRMLNRRI